MNTTLIEYKSGDITAETRFDRLHPNLTTYTKEHYSLCQSYNKTSQYSAKLIIFYDHSNKLLKTYFAQTLKYNGKRIYSVVSRKWVVGTPKPRLTFNVVGDRARAHQIYKSVFHDVYEIRKNASVQWSFKESPLVSFEPLKSTQVHNEVNCGLVYSALRSEKYEHFSAGKKRFIKLIITDFNKTETMRMTMGDLVGTAVGYPTQRAINKAKDILNELDRDMNNEETSISPRMASIFFHIYITNNWDKSNSPPMIDCFNALHEKRQLLQALQCEIYRNELTLPYRSRVNLLLGRLEYQLMMLYKGSNFVQAIDRCIRNTQFSPTQPSQLSLVNVYSFDSSITKPEDSYPGIKMLLWHGLPQTKVYDLLKNGFKSSEGDGCSTSGSGIYCADTIGLFVENFDPSRDNCEFVLTLNEVHLGKMKMMTSSPGDKLRIPSGFDSVVKLGCYRYDGDDYVIDDFDNMFYCGKLSLSKDIHNSLYTQYGVNDSKQMKLRYLVHVKINV